MRSFFSSSSSLKVLWTHTQIKIHYPKNRFSPQWLSSKQRGFLASFYQMVPKVTTDVASQITKSLALNSFLLFTTQRKWSKAKIIFLLVNFYRESFWRCKTHTKRDGEKTQKPLWWISLGISMPSFTDTWKPFLLHAWNSI